MVTMQWAIVWTPTRVVAVEEEVKSAGDKPARLLTDWV